MGRKLLPPARPLFFSPAPGHPGTGRLALTMAAPGRAALLLVGQQGFLHLGNSNPNPRDAVARALGRNPMPFGTAFGALGITADHGN